MLKVYDAANYVDAQLLCDRLRNHRISAEVHGGYLSGASGELPVDTAISIWLHDSHDEHRARHLIHEFEVERHQQPAAPLLCAQCGEKIEGNFSLCWNCGNSLTQTEV